MKWSLRNILFKLVKTFIPEIEELRWLSAHRLTSLSVSEINESEINDVKILAPYNIYKTTVGKGSYISRNAFISFSNIGKYCSIGPNVICGWGIHPTDGLSTSPVFYSTLNQAGFHYGNENKIQERKPIKIGNDVFIGMNVTILDGITIGNGAVIGAGAVVSKDIPPYAIAYGSPIKIVKYRFNEQQISQLELIKWWDFDSEKIREVEKYFFDIDKFIDKYGFQHAK
ncbi:CatB-related O-acetyltransferase [Mucilaginibacter aquariorum]|uniref:CatB-related O-acetyltransferase n=1 Tax=Mucilaginibacter aquariorum TaxID=2967225 RepID=A0ABT1SY51_9SPHI|nr:CatB-related O-acetyltransferase [Mucilaginibacter aquariorum]MCQ6957280.1 CatB-related O-acetyltransferase [Mucilaginibacter aquariorum]